MYDWSRAKTVLSKLSERKKDAVGDAINSVGVLIRKIRNTVANSG